MSKSNDKPTKITVYLFKSLYEKIDAQLSSALLRRDAFLDRVIATEIPHLREDLAGRRLSKAAHQYISRRLGKTRATDNRDDNPRWPVSIAVSRATADALEAVVKEHNLVRDAFIHRLIVLLRSTDKTLEAFDLPTRIESQRRDGTEDMPTGPLRAIEEAQMDPFYYLRAACNEKHDCGLYALPLPSKYDFMACYLPDEDVPGTPEHDAKQKLSDQLMMSL
ncbi:hypothetical protein PQR39_36345 [Paraburkholderia sediminicola]|uniref:hypothetical protein n=1 Tax=Paraburkholderia sediminicola TaxID=458836 RepID=UPI0038B71375